MPEVIYAKEKEVMEIMRFVAVVVLAALCAAFMLILAGKWGLLEWVQIHGCRLLSEMARCGFCLSFWTGLALSVVLLCMTGDWLMLTIPVFSAPITRMLL